MRENSFRFPGKETKFSFVHMLLFKNKTPTQQNVKCKQNFINF